MGVARVPRKLLIVHVTSPATHLRLDAHFVEDTLGKLPSTEASR
jgi:hypothetical protein